MTYATQQDLVDRFGEDEIRRLTDKDALGVIDATAVARALADADGEIDGYLAGRYGAPLATVPKVIVRIAADIARYHLYDDLVPDQIKDRYKDSVRFLKDAAAGQVSLGVDDAGAKPSSSNNAQMETGGHVFGRNDKGFM